MGEMLKGVEFEDGQLLAASRDWAQSNIDDVNGLLPLITPIPPPAVSKPGGGDATAGIGRGISLAGKFQLTPAIGVPLFLQFGGDKKSVASTPAPTVPAAPIAGQPESPATEPARKPASATPGASSQSKLDKVVGAVRIKKVALICEGGRLGLKLTGGLTLAAFEFELMGLQVTVPQTVLNDPSQATDIAFSLDGFSADIHNGTLTIQGAFLHQHHDNGGDDNAGYDEYNGVIQVAVSPALSLTGMGSYAKFNGHPSIFLFAALGYPMPLTAALLIEGLALGFGVHRDFILPKLDEILTYPLIQVSVTPPPPIDIQAMAASMDKFFPPADGQYFVVAGVKFKAFEIVDTVAMLALKFGKSFEIDLIGVSSILYPATFIELAWMARFAPEAGYLSIGGQLTSRSYVFVPEAQLTGGFAVAAWFLNEHQGDFVVTIGGYHPLYQVPAHYPDHLPRLGISFYLDPVTVKGGVYFAVTPQCLMLGGSLEISLNGSYDAFVASATFQASLTLAIDAIVFFEPFHYDVLVAADARLLADITFAFYTKHIDAHMHLDVHVWGPKFSGSASLDVGPKTFDVAFGAASSVKALPIAWKAFCQKFLQTKGKDGVSRDIVCTLAVTAGVLRHVTRAASGNQAAEVYVVDLKQAVIEAKSAIPITTIAQSDADPALKLPAEANTNFGIVPMDIRAGVTATLSIRAFPVILKKALDALPNRRCRLHIQMT